VQRISFAPQAGGAHALFTASHSAVVGQDTFVVQPD
jgi:hypothetical protein